MRIVMMNFDNLNKMIEYIEKNLTNEIDYHELSKITNTNIFILERIFMFLTNMTIIEYINVNLNNIITNNLKIKIT